MNEQTFFKLAVLFLYVHCICVTLRVSFCSLVVLLSTFYWISSKQWCKQEHNLKTKTRELEPKTKIKTKNSRPRSRWRPTITDLNNTVVNRRTGSKGFCKSNYCVLQQFSQEFSSSAWSLCELTCDNENSSSKLKRDVSATDCRDQQCRLLNAAARVVSGTRKFDRGLTQLLHWLDVPERVKYKLGMITCRCLIGPAPPHLAARCIPVSATASRQHLCSAVSHQLVVHTYRLSSYRRRTFSMAGPTTWNSLPRHLHRHHLWTFTEDTFLFRVLMYTAH